MIENLIAYHCGPALAGIKPANIVACYKDKEPAAEAEVKRLNKELNCRDIYLEILCNCDKRVLIMVYRRQRIEEYMQSEEINAFMQSLGYPKEFSVEAYIALLKERLKEESFPHEIGAFLGYPLHDICGFMNNDKYIFAGEWKVYKNEEKAKELFSRYRICRCAIMKRLLNGCTLSQLFCGNSELSGSAC